jgi:hypothetical protein
MNALRAGVVVTISIIQWFPNLKSGPGPWDQAKWSDGYYLFFATSTLLHFFYRFLRWLQ